MPQPRLPGGAVVVSGRVLVITIHENFLRICKSSRPSEHRNGVNKVTFELHLHDYTIIASLDGYATVYTTDTTVRTFV